MRVKYIVMCVCGLLTAGLVIALAFRWIPGRKNGTGPGADIAAGEVRQTEMTAEPGEAAGRETEPPKEAAGTKEPAEPEKAAGTEEPAEPEKAAGTEEPAEPETEPPVIVIDAGHQAKANTGKEPIGPGASEQKIKVAGGTRGVASGVAESELTLAIALLLEEELNARGYTVVQVRTGQDVDISNAERSRTANELGADVFLRLHANGAESSAANGAQTICPADDNPYMDADVIARSGRLSECILDAYTAATGCKREYVSRRNDMTGINWCEVPVTILEMGYMTNSEEDLRMQDPAYQEKMVTGIADGIDEYMKGEKE